MDSSSTNLWRHSEFLKFWAGQTVSVFGSEITALALPLTAALTLKATPAQMGLLSAATTLPFLLVGLFAGAWVDRKQRRLILITADIGRALLLGLIPLAIVLGFLNMPLLYIVVFLTGILTVFFDISYQAYLPALVSRRHLVEGNSKLEISYSTAQVAGPAIAGVLVRWLSAPIALVVDAVSFLVSAFSLALIGTREPAPEPTNGTGSNLWGEIKEGLGVVFGNRLLWSIAGATGTFNLFSSLWGSIFVLYLTRELGITPEVMGLIFSAGAPGALLGALVAGRVTSKIGLGRAIFWSQLLAGSAGLLILLARGPLLAVAFALIASRFLAGLANVVYNVNQVSLRQAITPDRLLGRMNASMRFLVWGTLPLGALIGGTIGQALGLRAAVTVGVLGGALSFLWVLFSPVRSLKEKTVHERIA